MSACAFCGQDHDVALWQPTGFPPLQSCPNIPGEWVLVIADPTGGMTIITRSDLEQLAESGER